MGIKKKSAENQPKFIHEDSPAAQRQPKTDLLILARLLRDESTKQFQDEEHVLRAHEVLVRWADLESSGRLAELNETQMQGSFLAEVFGEALGYTVPFEGAELFYQLQHETIAPGQTPDAILGKFRQGELRTPLAVVELKGPNVHLDRDRSSGRTAVDQAWDYLINCPTSCRWAIISNIVSFRLYERDSTKRKYEHFTLQKLRDRAAFRRFYALLHRHGLVEGVLKEQPRAWRMLQATNTRQREVGNQLYEEYSQHRLHFIDHLHNELHHPLERAIEYAQRLLDRVIFIAFCEDRGLLPSGTIKRAYEKLPAFSPITNPRWQNFKNLFRSVDQGRAPDPDAPNGGIHAYNGGLFAKSEADDLELDDRWTHFFHNIAGYSFADEVNLDVLGHLFERSITELEKLRATGIYGDAEKSEQFAKMPQSVKRKQLGIYYTPPELTLRIVQYTVDELIDERFAAASVRFGTKPAEAKRGVAPDTEEFWRECLAILRSLKIIDPACGSGAFLFQAYNLLEQRYFEVIGHLEHLGATDVNELAADVPRYILNDNLYGVDLSSEAVEITQLALWIRSATEGQTLATLSKNIVHGNSLVHDPAVHPAAFDWRERFPEVFQRAGSSPTPAEPPTAREPGFDCVIGNPPWERIKLQEREFFSLPAPEIATATNAAKRHKLVEKLEKSDPALSERYQAALAHAGGLLDYCRNSGEYPLTGKGDINLYAVFAELAYQLVAPHGRVGLLTPSGIAAHSTTKAFFGALADSSRLVRLYEFDNRLRKFFPEVHPDTQFVILNFCGEQMKWKTPDFIFGVLNVNELEDKGRHVNLTSDDIRLLNPNTRTSPIFHTKRDAEITKAIYRRVPVLIDHNREGPTGNPWGIKFKRMFDQTNDAELFREVETLKADGFKLKGNRWVKGKKTYLPLYEAKMVQAYDHRAAGVVVDESNWFRQAQTDDTSLASHQNPEFLAVPRWWISPKNIGNEPGLPAYLAFKNVTSPTNRRTMIAAMIPRTGVGNSAPLIFVDENVAPRSYLALLANLNCFALDYIARNKIGNVNLNFFLIEQFPMFPPDAYSKLCPWKRNTALASWISERVLKLTCTAVDMLPLAEACDFTSGSFQQEYGGRLHKWDEAERAQLMAELDAAYFHLYGINRDDTEYILSTFKGIHNRTPHLPQSESTAGHILKLYDEFTA